MGTAHSKPAKSPLEQFLQDTRDRAKSMKFIPGKASEFYFLCRDGQIDQVRQILNDEASLSIDELNRLQPNGSTPLHVATYNNRLEIVRLLLEHDCPRTTLNRYGNTAYDEAHTNEMKQLFHRYEPASRFHETDTTNTMALYLPENNIESVNASKTVNYIHLFQSESEIFEYSLNQQTTAMWLKFYNWFFHSFRTFIERDDLRVNAFDLINHPDFQEFLKRSLADPVKYAKTMESVNEANRRNSIEPLITLYTSEKAGFYRPFNRLLAGSSNNTGISEHLCDRYIFEFHLRRHELKQRAYTGTVYRGATVPVDSLIIYQHATESNPPGVLGFKAFTSTSRDPLVALQFALQTPPNEGEKHVLFIFEITEASPTIFGLDRASVFDHEQEVLILPGNLFTVTKIQEQLHPPMTKIYLKHWKISISFWQKIRQTIRAGKKDFL